MASPTHAAAKIEVRQAGAVDSALAFSGEEEVLGVVPATAVARHGVNPVLLPDHGGAGVGQADKIIGETRAAAEPRQHIDLRDDTRLCQLDHDGRATGLVAGVPAFPVLGGDAVDRLGRWPVRVECAGGGSLGAGRSQSDIVAVGIEGLDLPDIQKGTAVVLHNDERGQRWGVRIVGVGLFVGIELAAGVFDPPGPGDQHLAARESPSPRMSPMQP